MLEDILEVFLITYNRKAYLNKTLKAIFRNDSPLKDLSIVILDNKSTDGSSELIEEYRKKHPNIKHIIHNKNISGNGNITRAIELASKKYFWILCDDDKYKWKNWKFAQEGLEKDYDLILVEHLTQSNNINLPTLVNELAFLPAGIYKTDIVTDDVMQNAMANINMLLPHMALITSLVNNNKKIFISRHPVIIQNLDKGYGNGYKKGFNNDIYPRFMHSHLFVSFINSYQMIKDKKMRYKCCDTLWQGKTFAQSMFLFFRGRDLYRYNLCDIFNGISFRQKISFISMLLLYILMKPILFFKDRPVPYYLKDWKIYIENHNVIPKLEKNLEKYKGKKILLYGKGLVTKAILQEKPEIINYFYAISDKRIGNYCEASNYPTKIPPTEIKNHKEIDLIFVSVYRYDIIKKYLKKLGVKTKTIKII